MVVKLCRNSVWGLIYDGFRGSDNFFVYNSCFWKELLNFASMTPHRSAPGVRPIRDGWDHGGWSMITGHVLWSHDMSCCHTEGGIFEATLRPSDRATDRAVDRSSDRSSERSTDGTSDRTSGRESDRAKRPNKGGNDRPNHIISRPAEVRLTRWLFRWIRFFNITC